MVKQASQIIFFVAVVVMATAALMSTSPEGAQQSAEAVVELSEGAAEEIERLTSVMQDYLAQVQAQSAQSPADKESLAPREGQYGGTAEGSFPYEPTSYAVASFVHICGPYTHLDLKGQFTKPNGERFWLQDVKDLKQIQQQGLDACGLVHMNMQAIDMAREALRKGATVNSVRAFRIHFAWKLFKALADNGDLGSISIVDIVRWVGVTIEELRIFGYLANY